MSGEIASLAVRVFHKWEVALGPGAEQILIAFDRGSLVQAAFAADPSTARAMGRALIKLARHAENQKSRGGK